MSPRDAVARMYRAGLAYTRITAETGWNRWQIYQVAHDLGLLHLRRKGRPPVDCAKRRGPRPGCRCDVCRAHWRRLNYNRSQRPGLTTRGTPRKLTGQGSRPDVLRAIVDTAKPRRWRCCGWLQVIPEGETARCGRCGTVPLFARPEPDLRQFRIGR